MESMHNSLSSPEGSRTTVYEGPCVGLDSWIAGASARPRDAFLGCPAIHVSQRGSVRMHVGLPRGAGETAQGATKGRGHSRIGQGSGLGPGAAPEVLVGAEVHLQGDFSTHHAVVVTLLDGVRDRVHTSLQDTVHPSERGGHVIYTTLHNPTV